MKACIVTYDCHLLQPTSILLSFDWNST